MSKQMYRGLKLSVGFLVVYLLIVAFLSSVSTVSAAADPSHKDESLQCDCKDYGHPGWVPVGNTNGKYGKDWWCVEPTPTHTPSPTHTHTPTVTSTPTVTQTVTVTNTQTNTSTPTQTATTPTQTVTPTNTETPTATPSTSPTPNVTPTVPATATPEVHLPVTWSECGEGLLIAMAYNMDAYLHSCSADSLPLSLRPTPEPTPVLTATPQGCLTESASPSSFDRTHVAFYECGDPYIYGYPSDGGEPYVTHIKETVGHFDVKFPTRVWKIVITGTQGQTLWSYTWNLK